MGFQFVSSRIHSSNSIRSLSFLQSLVLVTIHQSVQLLSHRVFCGIAPAGTAILGLHRHHEMMRSTLYIRADDRVTSFRTTFPLCCILCCAQERPETLTCPKGVERHHHQRKTMKTILNGPVVVLKNVLFRINSKNTGRKKSDSELNGVGFVVSLLGSDRERRRCDTVLQNQMHSPEYLQLNKNTVSLKITFKDSLFILKQFVLCCALLWILSVTLLLHAG